ncbi:MAG: hypothetical protein M9939_26355 [Mesorhizobium sp.]|nr:hypothetical protein [Mesorhizobium sp.]MCO5085131.1 hypothetical protein [Rhizobiaceae bacterium]MCO5164615.1 hypothetical protein [Mesorhizobium sp.]
MMSSIASYLISIADRRQPDICIGGEADPYMRRWWLIPRNRWFNIYLHHFMRSDDDRALHDHPWWNVSILLEGSYTKHTIEAGGVNRRTIRTAGDWKPRTAASAHRIELHAGPCWTLFITGPRIREWGFHCPQGWRHWRIFTAGPNGETVGRGCGENDEVPR